MEQKTDRKRKNEARMENEGMQDEEMEQYRKDEAKIEEAG
jgi:hypothetical protein